MSEANGNTAMGISLIDLTGGEYTTASAFYVPFLNTTGYQNTASGFQALLSNTASSLYAASKVNSLDPYTTGGANTASGAQNGPSPSVNQSFTPTANQATTTIALNPSPNPSTFGQAVALTATVSSSGGKPNGTVRFNDGNIGLGNVTLAGGVATFITTTLPAGTNSITAVYIGNPWFSGSTSSVLSQVVGQATSTITLRSSPNPSTFGQAVTLTAAVFSSGGTPNGRVRFNDGNIGLGNVMLAGGVATLTTTTLPAGTNSITAVYIGNTSFSGSTSSVLSQVVGQATSTIALSSSPNPSTFGQAVTLTAAVFSSGGKPNGTVRFNDGNIGLGNVVLAGGVATLTTTTLPAGRNSITAVYIGNTSFSGSTSSVLSQVVGHAMTTITLRSSLNPSTFGQAVTLTATVSSSATPNGTVTFTFKNGNTWLVNATLAGGVATLTTTTLPAGTNSITAVYIGNTSFSSSTSSVLSQVVGQGNTAVIQHIVVIFQENRSTDNLFQDPVLISRGADIVSSGKNSFGQTIALTPMDLGTSGSNPQNYDLGHSNTDFVAMYDGGKMDGANLIACALAPGHPCPPNAYPNPQFKYVKPADVQPYFALAEQYTFGDRMFQTNEGPSFPAHQFIISGTSAPTATSSLFASENPYVLGGGPAGCIAPPAETVSIIDANGSETSNPAVYPCFEHPTLTDLLQTNGVTWRYYTPSAGSIWTGPDAIEHICQQQTINGTLTCTGPDWTHNVVIPQTQVLVDIANGDLAQVTWIIPDGTSSDHAIKNEGSGPSWVASIVNAIGNSPFWANTAIIITWDDWGGWYDHVAPKVINDGTSWGSGYVYGFRVPLIVVSPYARAAYISHTTHDFGSILKFIEVNFNLPSLGYADNPADDLSDCFDLTQTPLSFQIIPAPLHAADFINDKRPPTDPDDD
jgi:phospholipase C